MKILTVSDVVEPSLYPVVDAGRHIGINLILACGDLPPEYLSFLSNFFSVPLYYVCGNHDIRYNKKRPMGCTDVHARLVRFRGLNFLGLGGSHWYNGGPHQYTEGQMRLMVFRMLPTLWRRGGVDVVITHAPPRYVHDAEDPCHRGFVVFRRLIRRWRPQYFIHGHIHCRFGHDSERISLIESTRVVNTYGYFQLEIDDRPAAG
ncbi:MAG: metallophosphoesterase [Desulfobacterales bacterium]|jgi:Icc-related predicted phosphoesterase